MNDKLNEPFLNPSTAEKYRRLGFVSADICMTLKIGNVSISAVENPLSGVALFFESAGNRTACQYESCAPEKCGVEQIAGLIDINIATNFRDSAELFRSEEHTSELQSLR